jgi:alpha-L-rhamnosidase
MHRRVAGLAPAEPGYRSIEVRPVPNSRLTHAAARHLTPYGEAAVSWNRSDGQLRLKVTVPVGSTAAVHVPGGAAPVEVEHGTHEWTVDDPCADTSPLPADPSIRQLLDHEPTWNAVAAAARDAGVVTDDMQLAARLTRFLDAPANQLVNAATAGGLAPGGDALRANLDALSL